ncbi:hypothetical protein Nepgr_033868 [Nepenthes gracilis]|uniref:Uncharacterized protein n=1 Tax=Nepenthes gracilis TaxID=150966 RepID=A0AAD3Y8Z6_NEPGR|nr:hypothetical protein Nepgr_033868 [Nepenthes gracilis]
MSPVCFFEDWFVLHLVCSRLVVMWRCVAVACCLSFLVCGLLRAVEWCISVLWDSMAGLLTSRQNPKGQPQEVVSKQPSSVAALLQPAKSIMQRLHCPFSARQQANQQKNKAMFNRAAAAGRTGKECQLCYTPAEGLLPIKPSVTAHHQHTAKQPNKLRPLLWPIKQQSDEPTNPTGPYRRDISIPRSTKATQKPTISANCPSPVDSIARYRAPLKTISISKPKPSVLLQPQAVHPLQYQPATGGSI